MADPVVNPCDVCGRPTAAADCAETLEEWLCWECASGIEEEEDEYWDEDYEGEDEDEDDFWDDDEAID